MKIRNTGMTYWKLVVSDAERIEDEKVIAFLSQMANNRWIIKDKHEAGKLCNQTFTTPSQAKKWLMENEGKY